jgi:hypothetical protein
MKIIKNRLFLVGSALLIGLIIGGGLTYYACTAFYTKYISAVKTSLNAVMEDYLFREEEEALNRFKEGSPVIGIYAQDRLINYLNLIKKYNSKKDKYALEMSFLETRKGILYEEMRDNQKALECFNNAAKIVKENNINPNPDSFVNTLKSELKKLRKRSK